MEKINVAFISCCQKLLSFPDNLVRMFMNSITGFLELFPERYVDIIHKTDMLPSAKSTYIQHSRAISSLDTNLAKQN